MNTRLSTGRSRRCPAHVAAALDDQEMERFVSTAHDLELDVLCEVHTFKKWIAYSPLPSHPMPSGEQSRPENL